MTIQKLTITEHNIQTDEYTTRLMTDAEFEVYKADKERDLAEKIANEEKALAKQAILDRLGLTAEELKTILG